jgi:hypothetical protein
MTIVKAVQKGLVGVASDKVMAGGTIYAKVKDILTRYPEARNSRMLVRLIYWMEFDGLAATLATISQLGRQPGMADQTDEQIAETAARMYRLWWDNQATDSRSIWSRTNEVQKDYEHLGPSPEVRARWKRQEKAGVVNY